MFYNPLFHKLEFIMNQQLPEINFDTSSLVKEEIYTDQKIGSVRVLTPVTVTGEIDPSRAVTFFGQTQVMSPAGAIPLNFELETTSLAEAFKLFGDSAKLCMEQTMKEIQEYQREQASKIVVPGQSGSSIQMP